MDNDILRIAISEQVLPSVRVRVGSHAERIPLWIWWQLLSLDAPTVAIVWALLIARCADVSLPVSQLFGLGAAVWLIYSADRILDGKFARRGERLHRRHYFHVTQVRQLSGVGFVVLVALGALFAAGFSAPERYTILLLVGFVAAYFAWIRLPINGIKPKFAKEIAVGAIFAAGTVLPVWIQGESERGEIACAALLLAALCSVNCVAIEYWENEAVEELDQKQFKRRERKSSVRLPAYVLTAACAFAILVTPANHAYDQLIASCCLALTLLAQVHLSRKGFSGEELRVLADAVLVLPALLALLRMA